MCSDWMSVALSGLTITFIINLYFLHTSVAKNPSQVTKWDWDPQLTLSAVSVHTGHKVWLSADLFRVNKMSGFSCIALTKYHFVENFCKHRFSLITHKLARKKSFTIFKQGCALFILCITQNGIFLGCHSR